MRNLHSTFIRATKKIINQRLNRTNSPDARRAPHTIDSPFNIPHPHLQALVPSLYILVKTTAQGILKKVSLPIRDEQQSITSPGDSAGYIACACQNPNDPSDHHNVARLIAGDQSTVPTLSPSEHFVSSPLVFPNILIQDPLENNGTHILVKLPDHIKTVEQLSREQVLECVHQVLNDFGPTEVADNVYTERFTVKALGIQPSAPTLRQTTDQPEEPSVQDRENEQQTFHRAQLSKNWVKSYTEKRERKHSGGRTSSRSRSESEQEDQHRERYEIPSYISPEPPQSVILWASQAHIAPAIDLAFQKWNPTVDVPTEHIRRQDRAIVITPGTAHAKMMAISTEPNKSFAIANLSQYYKTEAEAGRVRVGLLIPVAMKHIKMDYLTNIPMEIYDTVREILHTTQGGTYGNPRSDSENTRSQEVTSADENWDEKWDHYDLQNRPRGERGRENRPGSRNKEKKHKTPTQPTATCPHCKAMFLNATAALKHVQDQHQNTTESQNQTNTEKEKMGKPKILKASQYQDSYIQISLPNDEAAHFFTATAQTMKDPRTNTIETRYIAPRFPESILAIEDMVAFKNVATKEFQKWFKAYQQITNAKKMGSYRTYQNHNIGLENSYTALMIAGQKDKITTLKANAPTLYPTKISELNEHLVTSFFHNQRIYCLESRIEWSSWYELCFSERTIGREILERVQSRLTSYPTAFETLKSMSSFVEHIVTSLLPVQVPYSQRRIEIINMHTSQLNSAVPTVDFTRQHIDSHAVELRFLHPAANSAVPLSTEQESRLQDNIVDELLHEILAGTPFFGRLNQLYLPNPQYQDIRRVPKAKILEDLARIIATDRTTGANTATATRMTSTYKIATTKEPARCTACAALNTTCAPNHCRLHQPTWTPNEVKNIQRNHMNPFRRKADCNQCQEELIRKGIAGLKTHSNKEEHKKSKSDQRNRSPRKSPSRSRSREKKEFRRSRSNSRTRESKNNKPQVRTILSRSPGDTERREYEKKNEGRPPYWNPATSGERQRSQQESDWTYARGRSPGYQRQPSQTRWQQRSPSPRDRIGANRLRSRSPRSPHNRGYSPYRSRSQSDHRQDTRNRTFNRRSASRSREPDREQARGEPEKTAGKD